MLMMAPLVKPDTILTHPDVRATLDYVQPIGLIIVGTLVFIKDSEDPVNLVKHYTDALPSGSYLAISHVTAGFNPEAVTASARAYNTGPTPFTPRTGGQIARSFQGFYLVEPGLVKIFDWRPDEAEPVDRNAGDAYGAVGSKP